MQSVQFLTRHQGNLSLLPKEKLPTMYDLPSEDPEEPGLPDEFHDLQPELFRLTFQPPEYYPNRVFSGSDMNLYYDVNNHYWHKRPDWFGVLGVNRLYDNTDLRLSYVIWQEEISPFAIVELLSPGTEKEDLGETEISANRPPTKWEVYEQILQVPYYVVFNRYNNQLQAFHLGSGQYQELKIASRILMPEISLSLGLWAGEYQGINRLWLRWYDAEGKLILTDAEKEKLRTDSPEQLADAAKQRADAAEQRADTAEQRAEYLAQRLRELGIEP
jgi:Uma2 family endonuclease